MSVKTLALLGGEPVRTHPFPVRHTIREEEKKAVLEVLDSGNLSAFFGSPGDLFLGGPKVLELEAKWARRYGFKHAISVNSWTSGLMTAVGAAGIGPGDEVICTPYTMSASATSILFYGGIPIFADVEPRSYCLDPHGVENAVTPRTRAIMVVHLFGHPANMDALLRIAAKHRLKVIEDAAHAPGATYHGRQVGALGDLGGFSLNYHKHIHTGEGGILVTQHDELAQRCQLIRNHGENIVESMGVKDIGNLIGANYRLTEIQAAIGTVQLDRLDSYLAHRNRLAAFLGERLAKIPGLTPPQIEPGCTHSFYVYAARYDEEIVGVPRSAFVEAVARELPPAPSWEQLPFAEGYVKPLYLSPVYQRKIAIGSDGFPFNYHRDVEYNYAKGLCPVVERLYEKELLICPLVREPLEEQDLMDFVNAVEKVIENSGELKRRR